MVSKDKPDLGIIANILFRTAQANGDSDRLLERYAMDVRRIYKNEVNFTSRSMTKIFDYHRDFNLTYPVQLMLDLSTTFGKPDWFILPSTQMGVRWTWRSFK